MGGDEHYMRRALELAASLPTASPNPRVGAVVVRDGTTLAEARHEGPGTPHAETVALGEAGDATGATLYLTLEPCTHQGRTAPCLPVVVDSGVARVVVAMSDPDPRVAGAGIAGLQEAGIEVSLGVGGAEAHRLNEAYGHHRTTGRPLVRLKLALSLDGRLAAPDGSARWITGPEARGRAHALRGRVDAVLVGAGTVVMDDPLLTPREVMTDRAPVRVVIDGAGRVPATAQTFAEPGRAVVATSDRCPHDVMTAWKEAGAEVVVLPSNGTQVDLDAVIVWLGRHDMTEVMCEGGAMLATSLLREQLVDRLEIHRGARLIGGAGPQIGDLEVTTIADASRWALIDSAIAGSDVITTYSRKEA